MDKVNSDSSVGKMKESQLSTHKTITPAVLGIPSPHGLKLSSNMTSRDKQQLLCKLEEWRKARREKLALSILSKNKSAEKAKLLAGCSKPKPVSNPSENCNLKNIPGRESVFERLYKNSSKVKKENDVCPAKTTTMYKNRFSAFPTFSKTTKSNTPAGVSLGKESPPQSVPPTADANPSCTVKPTPGNADVVHFDLESVPEENSKELSVEEIHSKPGSPKVEEVLEKEEKVNLFVEIELAEKQRVCEEEKVSENKNFNVVAEKGEIHEDVLFPTFSHGSHCTGKSRSDEFLEVLGTGPSPQKEELKKPVVGVPEEKSFNAPICVKGKAKVPLRRSISMLYRSKRPPESAIHRAASEKNLKELECQKDSRASTRPNDDRSLKKSGTPAGASLNAPRKTNALSSDILRNKLESWLKVNGHSLKGYRHLRCFGVDRFSRTSPKEKAVGKSASCPDDSDKENLTPPPTVIQKMDEVEVENWLKELFHLISELKYPPDRCEEWLAAIRKKCASCTQTPTYWECLAALDEARGDMESAVEHYEKAIIKGKDVDSVGNALAQLFDKMVIEQGKPSKNKLEKGLDPKNIFKSTIIKFALQQKALKESGSDGKRQQLVATPVRRSTRIQTPLKEHIVSSLQALTPELRSNVTFKPNESLINGQ